MDSLILNNVWIIKGIAKKFYHIEYEDLYQAGCLGLIKAAKNYKGQDGEFANYAYKYVFGEMYDLSLKSRNIKLTKEYYNIYKKVSILYSKLTQEYEREVTLKEISKELNISLEDLERIMNIVNDMQELDKEYDSLNLSNSIDYDSSLLINDAIDTLDPLSSAVINYRYKYDLTQTEVANVLGISQVKVSRIEKNGKQKILEYIS